MMERQDHLKRKWKYWWLRDRTIWIKSESFDDGETGPFERQHRQSGTSRYTWWLGQHFLTCCIIKTYNTDDDDDSSRSPLVIISHCLQPAQTFERNVGSIFWSNSNSTDTDLMSFANNGMWLWLKTLRGGFACYENIWNWNKFSFWNWKEGCHADNSSGGVSLCQSVALDVEDFGNGALETECEVVKTVGGNSQNRKLETNNWFTYRRRFGWPPWIQKQYTQKRLHSHPTSTKSFILGIRPVELFYPSVQSSPFSETQVQVPTSQTYQIDPPWPRAGCQFLCSLWTLPLWSRCE